MSDYVSKVHCVLGIGDTIPDFIYILKDNTGWQQDRSLYNGLYKL